MYTDAELAAMSIPERAAALDEWEREEAAAVRDAEILWWETHPARR